MTPGSPDTLSCGHGSRPWRETDPCAGPASISSDSAASPAPSPCAASGRPKSQRETAPASLHVCGLAETTASQAALASKARPGRRGEEWGRRRTAQTEGLTERGSERRRRRCEFSELRVFRDLMEGTDRQGGGLPEQGNQSPIQTEGHTHS